MAFTPPSHAASLLAPTTPSLSSSARERDQDLSFCERLARFRNARLHADEVAEPLHEARLHEEPVSGARGAPEADVVQADQHSRPLAALPLREESSRLRHRLDKHAVTEVR